LHESLGQLDRLESTISSLLALARQTDRARVECDVLELCRDDAAHWRDAVERDGRQLLVSGDGVTARVDADALRHVLDVLIDNALHHGKGDINVVAHGNDATVAIEVSDEGPAPLGRDPFADTGSDSAHGIGLRLARSLAESSQGRLELVDSDNTTFRLTVPV
jgi:signal transduction histidine kinase